MIPAYLRLDSYKLGHAEQYPENTTKVYSNFTPRSDKHLDIPEAYKDNRIVWVGAERFIYDLADAFDNFFFREFEAEEVKEFLAPFCGPNGFNIERLKALHKLGYLPIQIKALPAGSIVPIGVPVLTIVNTHPDFGWLPNSLETWLSAELWKPSTVATIARAYRKVIENYAELTGGNKDFITWQAHDFSIRGMSGIQDAANVGKGHLMFFNGTDNIPAVLQLVQDYALPHNTFIGGSVPATEHSVMCAGGKESEIETFRRLIKLYPSGVFSVVSDTWNFWDVLTVIAPGLKDEILNRVPDSLGLAKVVFRPDSGDPEKIICGDPEAKDWRARAGAVRLLWDTFGGTVNEKGFKTLNQRVGLIYGDSITVKRAQSILDRLAQLGFASDNIVFGVGSYTYQYITRDTLGFAMKATFVEIDGVGYEIFKDPVTDSGTKKSAKGRLFVGGSNGNYFVRDQVSAAEEQTGALKVVFSNGNIIGEDTWDQVVARAREV